MVDVLPVVQPHPEEPEERALPELNPGRARSSTAARVLVGALVVGLTVVATAGSALAQDAEGTPDLATVADIADHAIVSGNLAWIVIGAALVIFMQAGFALVETGFCRAKHAAHVVSTNVAIFFLGFAGFFLVGFPFMYGSYSYALPGFDYGLDHAVGGSLIGSGDWIFLHQGGWAGSWFDGNDLAYAGALGAFFLYMAAFMDTTATIPTGAMAERWRFSSFCVWGLFVGAVYYPLFGAWTWGGGWLAKLGDSMGWGNGYVDFAGSGVVHATGGVAALAGAMVLGPRIGKFGKDGKPRALPGHHLPMAMLGTFILLFGWFGFNAGSTFATSDPQIGVVAVNTALGGVFGGLSGMLWIWLRIGKPDPAMMVNGLLAGLVMVTAGCAFFDPWAAAVLGLVAGVVVIEAVFFIERRMKVDDPVGAIAVHGVCGSLGVIAVGLFANGRYGVDAGGPGIGWNGTTGHVDANGVAEGVTGILYSSSGAGQLLAQLVGVAVIWTVMLGLASAFFKIQDRVTKGGIRSNPDDERAGLDLPEMGALAYPDFVQSSDAMYGEL